MSFKDTKSQLSNYITDVFIETGTYHGETSMIASTIGFKKVISIELQEHILSLAKESSKGYNIEFHLGDSVNILKKIIPSITNQITFWLDAHLDDCNILPNITPKIRKCPLMEELEIISKSNRNDHIILIDDYRLFGIKNVWAEDLQLEKILESLYKINSNYKITFIDGYVESDIIVAKV